MLDRLISIIEDNAVLDGILTQYAFAIEHGRSLPSSRPVLRDSGMEHVLDIILTYIETNYQ